MLAFKPDKSTRLDKISLRFERWCNFLSWSCNPHLEFISFDWDREPLGFKKARVKPLYQIYKKGSRLDVGSYRPVSNLPVMSRILECNCYLKKHNLLYCFQSGFWQGFSTETRLVNLFDSIKTQTANGNFTDMVLIDLQRAFDYVDHGTLLNKLSSMGVAPTYWFRFYFCDRLQRTVVAGIDSHFFPVNCGDPQGSICFMPYDASCP